MKRTVALLLSVLMLLSALASAEYVGLYNAELPITEEVTEYAIWVKTAANEGKWNELWYTQFIENLTGIRLNGTDISEAGWADEISLAFGTQDLPDCIAMGLNCILRS